MVLGSNDPNNIPPRPHVSDTTAVPDTVPDVADNDAVPDVTDNIAIPVQDSSPALSTSNELPHGPVHPLSNNVPQRSPSVTIAEDDQQLPPSPTLITGDSSQLVSDSVTRDASQSPPTGGKGQYTQWVHCELIVGSETIRPAHTQRVNSGYIEKVPTHLPSPNPAGK